MLRPSAAANSGNAAAAGAPSGPPCFSSAASSAPARRTTAPARRPAPPRARPRTARPRLRRPRAGTPRCPSIPSPAWCAAAAAAGDPPVPQARGNVWRRWCGSGLRRCSASSTAQAMARPSSVAVPRPISSTTTSDCGPGLVQDRGGLRHLHHEGGAAARQVVRGADPAEQPVHDADAAASAGHRQAGLRQHDDQRILPQEGRFAGHVRAGQQQHPPLGRQVAIVGDEARPARPARLPPPDAGRRRSWNASSSVTPGGTSAPASASRAADCSTSSSGERVGAGGQIGPACASTPAHQMGEHQRARARRRARPPR